MKSFMMKPSKVTATGNEMKKSRKFGYQYYKASVSWLGETFRRSIVLGCIPFSAVELQLP